MGNNELAWTNEAACDGMDRELFFAESANEIRAAKKICAACPVAIPCLVYALEWDHADGIWGGTTGKERAGLVGARPRTKRRRRRSATGRRSAGKSGTVRPRPSRGSDAADTASRVSSR